MKVERAKLHRIVAHPGGTGFLRPQITASLECTASSTQIKYFKLVDSDDLLGLDSVSFEKSRASQDYADRKVRALGVLAGCEYAIRLVAPMIDLSLMTDQSPVLLFPHFKGIRTFAGDKPEIAEYRRVGSERELRFNYLSSNQGDDRLLETYACLSYDIQIHECGHCILDATKRWYAGDWETRAIAETVCDIMVLFAKTRLQVFREFVAANCRDLREESNALSRFGDHLRPGNAVRDAHRRGNLATGSTDPYEHCGCVVGALYHAFAAEVEEQHESQLGRPDRIAQAARQLMISVFNSVRLLPDEESTTISAFANALIANTPDSRRQEVLRRRLVLYL